MEGYAPFCKHVFVPNFTDALVTAFPVTPENVHLLKYAFHVFTWVPPCMWSVNVGA